MLIFGLIVLAIVIIFGFVGWAAMRPDPYDRYLTEDEDDLDEDDGDEGEADDDEDFGHLSYADRLALYSNDSIPEQGKWARFEYEDHDGATSRRQITMWEKRGIYVVGYDRAKKGERTFRQDRISDWKCG